MISNAAAKIEDMSISKIKKLPFRTLNRIINKAKKQLKTDETWQKACKEYGEDVDIIDFIPVKFGNLDVSGKTDHGVVILNWKLLKEDDFTRICSYLLHEANHHLQQCCGDHPTQSADDGDYLKNPYEVESFQDQIEYIADHEGEKEADEYVDNLLEHHDKDGNEADELKAVLLEKVEAKYCQNTDFIVEAETKYPPEVKTRLTHVKKLLSKYHPDKPTGDLGKYLALVGELKRLQGENQGKITMAPPKVPHFEPEIVEEPKEKSVESPPPNKIWGDWFSSGKYDDQ
jgi:hypothetical protein